MKQPIIDLPRYSVGVRRPNEVSPAQVCLSTLYSLIHGRYAVEGRLSGHTGVSALLGTINCPQTLISQ